MNLALSTFVLFLLLLPGLAFRRFYYSEEFSREYFKESFFGLFTSTIIPSLLFQLIGYYASYWFGHGVDFYVFTDFLSSSPAKETIKNVSDNFIPIFFYNFILIAIAGALGYFTKRLVRYKEWDRKFRTLRYRNSWHYVVTGEFMDFPSSNIFLEKDTVADIEFVVVDAMVELKEGTFIYDGVLVDYELSSQNGLESISLSNVGRKKINETDVKKIDRATKTEDYYPINGHIIIIKYADIRNVNFTYFTLDNIGEDEHKLGPREIE